MRIYVNNQSTAITTQNNETDNMTTRKYTVNHRSDTSITAWLRNAKRSMRMACVVSIFALIHAVLFPHLAMAQAGLAEQEAAEKIVFTGSPEQQMNQALLKVQETVSEKQLNMADRLRDEGGTLDSVLSFFGLSQLQLEEMDSLEQLDVLLSQLNQSALDNFADTEARLIEKNLPEEILQRHHDMVADYQQHFDKM
jgi:hypothetical protein